MNDAAVRELARLAGIATDWTDALGRPRRVEIGPLRAILSALGFSCETNVDLAESRARLTGTDQPKARPLITATVGSPISLSEFSASQAVAGEIVFENECGAISGIARAASIRSPDRQWGAIARMWRLRLDREFSRAAAGRRTPQSRRTRGGVLRAQPQPIRHHDW